MKEASGELSMTAITVVAIAAIAGVFTTLVYPRIKASIVNQTKCATKYNCNECTNGEQTCKVTTDDGGSEDAVCPCDENQ